MSRRTRRARAAGGATPTRPRARLSRRRFMSLIAAGSAAAVIAPAQRVVVAATPKPAGLSAPMLATAKVRAEIDKQKKSTDAQLKVIRDYVLPAGSPMAFEFRPMRRRGK